MPRPKKEYKNKSIRLASELVSIAENSLSGATETIELGLRMILAAKLGDKTAIRLLAKFGVSPFDLDKEAHQASETP